jgi:hypothetical protein
MGVLLFKGGVGVGMLKWQTSGGDPSGRPLKSAIFNIPTSLEKQKPHRVSLSAL